MRKLSIIITSTNIESLIKCMDSILQYTIIKDIEFIFVIHGDPNYEKIYPYVDNITNYDKLIKILWYRKVIENADFEGIKQSTGKNLLILKDDFIVNDHGWLNTKYF
mgnify:CR=1 FL=1